MLKGHDAIISAASFIPDQAEKLIESVRTSGVKRFLMVGGAASLETEPGGKKVIDTLDLPDAWKGAIMEGMRTLKLLREENSFDSQRAKTDHRRSKQLKCHPRQEC
jgi:putative NADH-flavin reductase